MKLWIVGQVNKENYREWAFQGVFDSEESAVEACKDENYFLAPSLLNEILLDEFKEWESAYYPKSENE